MPYVLTGDEHYLDLRAFPCCYILDENRTIVNKALSVEGLMSAVNPMYR